MTRSEFEKILDEAIEKNRNELKVITEKYQEAILKGSILKFCLTGKDFNPDEWERDEKGRFLRYLGSKGERDNKEYGDKSEEIDNRKALLSEADRWEKKLSATERKAINGYTGEDYISINSNLRGLEYRDPFSGELIGADTDEIKNIDSAISKFKFEEDIRVYRGTSMELLETIGINPRKELVGQKICDKGYMSTSVSHKRAEKFIGYLDERDAAVMIEIVIGKGRGVGAYIEALSNVPKEQEFLLGRGSVISITETGRLRGDDKQITLIKAVLEVK